MSDNLPERSKELQAKIDGLLSRVGQREARRRHTPVDHRRIMKTQAPSRLSDLDGSRAPGGTVRHYATTKAPKRRFKPGDKFHYDGTDWEIIYMYRVKHQPGVWIHCLEERKPKTFLGAAFEFIGAGATTPRIVISEFPTDMEARQYFWDIYRHGDSMHKTTQQLLAMEMVVDQEQLPQSKD